MKITFLHIDFFLDIFLIERCYRNLCMSYMNSCIYAFLSVKTTELTDAFDLYRMQTCTYTLRYWFEIIIFYGSQLYWDSLSSTFVVQCSECSIILIFFLIKTEPIHLSDSYSARLAFLLKHFQFWVKLRNLKENKNKDIRENRYIKTNYWEIKRYFYSIENFRCAAPHLLTHPAPPPPLSMYLFYTTTFITVASWF